MIRIKVVPAPAARRIAIVTGGASGIGRATALALAALEITVAVVDVDADGAGATTRALEAAGGQASTVVADLSDRAAVARIVPTVLSQHGAVDVLVNAAGVVTPGGLLAATLEEWDLVHAVNLTAPFLLIVAAGQRMVEQGRGGHIVNVSSSSAFRAKVVAPYASSKAGLLGLTRAAAGELGPHGINVNAVAPGLTATPMARATVGDDDEMRAQAISGRLANLLGRVAEPEDVANVIAFLCTPASRQITGQTIHTSAGLVV